MGNKIRPSQLETFSNQDVRLVLPSVSEAMDAVPDSFSLQKALISDDEAENVVISPLANICGDKYHVTELSLIYPTTQGGELYMSSNTSWVIFHPASFEICLNVDNRLGQPLRMVGGDWEIVSARKVGNNTKCTVKVDADACYMVTMYWAMYLIRVEKLQEIQPITE